MAKRKFHSGNNLISMKYLSTRKDNNAATDESMECLQTQLHLEKMKNKERVGSDLLDKSYLESKV